MNLFKGVISGLESTDMMSRVKVDVAGTSFSAVVLETVETAPYLVVGGAISVLFKETEVILGKGISGKISLRNRGVAKVSKVERSPILTKVTMQHAAGSMVSVISTEGAADIGIAAGDEIQWFVKQNEISLARG